MPGAPSDRTTSGQDEARVRCAACGDEQPASALFCRRCTAPLGVAALHELDAEDLRISLTALLQTLSDASQAPRAPIEDAELWSAYLSAFWLRPETALVLYAESLAVRRMWSTMESPWLDLGCGDGINTAIQHGWRFAPEFDCFQSLDLAAADIYNHWDPCAFEARVVKAGPPIAWGVDIKPTAIERARALGVFCRLQQADATALPLADKSVRTIFSNMLRDLGAPLGAALRECRRVLVDDGVLLISAMTPAYRENLFFYPAARQAELRGETETARRMIRLDRGRSVFCQRQLTIPQWEDLLREDGLRVVATEPIVGPSVIRFWDTGLRPFTTTLLRHREAWREAGTLAAMKAGVCGLADHLLRPLAENPLAGGEPCMLLLAVRKA